jgi:cytochrome d ubiquinol oxidase subunit I
MLMDAVFLARMQFAPKIALGWALLFFRVKHLRAHDARQQASRAGRAPSRARCLP